MWLEPLPVVMWSYSMSLQEEKPPAGSWWIIGSDCNITWLHRVIFFYLLIFYFFIKVSLEKSTLNDRSHHVSHLFAYFIIICHRWEAFPVFMKIEYILVKLKKIFQIVLRLLRAILKKERKMSREQIFWKVSFFSPPEILLLLPPEVWLDVL